MTEQLFLHNKKIWQPIDVGGLMRGHVVLEAIEAVPSFKWSGPLIPLSEWRKILSFFKWAYDTHHSEAQVRLFLNQTLRTWKVWAFPQEVSGATTKELKSEEEVRQRMGIEKGFEEFGSVHSHASMNAFQSGTDENDESDRPGLHITIGNLDDKVYSIHTRVTFVYQGNKIFYTKVDLRQWFETPDWIRNIPKHLQPLVDQAALERVQERLLTSPADDVFPEIWKSNLTKHKWESQAGFFNGAGYTSSDWNTPTPPDKTNFLKGVADILDQYNLSPDDMADILPVIMAIYQLVMKSPRIMMSNAEDIIEEGLTNGELEAVMVALENKAAGLSDLNQTQWPEIE